MILKKNYDCQENGDFNVTYTKIEASKDSE